MRVLVDYRPALRQRTGVGEYVHELVRALVAPGGPARQHAVSLFTASWKDRPAPDLGPTVAPATVIDCRVPGRLLRWGWHRLSWPPAEWLAGPADVVHSASPLAMPSRAAASVLTIHDLHFVRHPERMSAEMRRDFPRLVRPHAERAAAIVVSSRYTAADVMATLGVPAARVHVCPAGAPPWAEGVRQARTERRPGHLLFLGTLEPRKNIGTLLDAYARLRARDAAAPRLVLAGQVTPAAAEWVRRASEAPLAGHVEVAGYVDDETRRRLLIGAHLVVLPSLDEGFGLPVLEAMACAVPVVISSGGSLPEIAGDAAAPVDPQDVEGLADRMAALLDPGEARRAAARGLARAAGFRWEDTARLVWAAYEAAAGGRP